MSTIVAFVSIPAPDEFSSRTLAVFSDGTVSFTANGRGSSQIVHMTRAEALALAEAITQNVKEPAHV